MPQISIDGTLLNVENGKTIIEAAYSNGLQIPHFCWHPELSVSGNCRMCLVEVGLPKRLPDGSFEHDTNGKPLIQWFPKLQIACATQISDGMEVHTKNDKVIEAQESVMEFLLINHPLDCPICDEAGECKLQDYAFNHSAGESRFTETKNHKPKHVIWGPNVIFDAERCISCSRCIRYSKEIAEQDVLTFVNRGDHVTIELFEGTQLDNPYSMNVIELCPVGALTSRDFRFQSRVWEMSFNESICTGCSRGCNISVGVMNNKSLRVQPRTNQFVNKYWLCDHGRLSLNPMLNLKRITSNLIRKDNSFETCTFSDAQNAFSKLIHQYKPSEVFILSSPFLTNEDNFVLNKFAKEVLKTKNIAYLPNIDEKFSDMHLKTNDKSPNSKGANENGIHSIDEVTSLRNLIDLINKNETKLLIVFTEGIPIPKELIETTKNLDAIISISSNFNELAEISDIVFAASTFAEVEGTFTNVDQRVQHFEPVLVTKENIARMGMKMSRWDKFGSFNDNWTQKEIRDSLPVWKIISKIATSFNVDFGFTTAKEIFDYMSLHISSFNGMSYDALDSNKGLKLNQGRKTEKYEYEYISHTFKPY